MHVHFLLLCFMTIVITVRSVGVRWPRILLMGDARTEFAFNSNGCWGALMYDRLARTADVVNRGYGGYDSTDFLTILDEAMAGEDATNIAAVTVLLGTVDAGKRSPASGYYNNVITLIDRLVNQHKVSADKIILLAPPGVDRKRINIDLEPFAKETIRAGEASNVTTLNLFQVFSSDLRKGDLFYDGVDFSLAGSQLLLDNLWPLVQLRLNDFMQQP